MSKSWPFENEPDPLQPIRRPEDFVAQRGEGTEAVVVRIGLHDAQLVLVDGEGGWQRWVYASVEAAVEAAEALQVPVHVGQYPEETRVRMNTYVRPRESFDAGAYPEQGDVGPVIPYPENRPRSREARRPPASETESS